MLIFGMGNDYEEVKESFKAAGINSAKATAGLVLTFVPDPTDIVVGAGAIVIRRGILKFGGKIVGKVDSVFASIARRFAAGCFVAGTPIVLAVSDAETTGSTAAADHWDKKWIWLGAVALIMSAGGWSQFRNRRRRQRNRKELQLVDAVLQDESPMDFVSTTGHEHGLLEPAGLSTNRTKSERQT
jgi:hypothetical protein